MRAGFGLAAVGEGAAGPASRPDILKAPTGPSDPSSRLQHSQGLWHFRARTRRLFSLYGAIVTALALAGCGQFPQVYLQLGAGAVHIAKRYPGLIAADEPQAALIGRDVLVAGGNAADAAVAMGFALAVTLPSSAGLGGGGTCLVHDGPGGGSEVLDFTARAGTGDGPMRAAIPSLPRGLFALHARFGHLPWAQVVAPAEHLARFGATVSRALADDLTADGAVLAADGAALAAFMTPRRQSLQAGDTIRHVELADMLGQLRSRGPVDLLAAAGGSYLTAADLRGIAPRWTEPATVDHGDVRLLALPSGVGGGDFTAAYSAPDRSAAMAQTSAAPAATSYVIADSGGTVVACALTMGRPFGLGVMAQGGGFLLAPAPDAPPALALVIGLEARGNAIAFAVTAAGDGAVSHAATVAREFVGSPRRLDVTAAGKTTSARRSSLANVLACARNESVAVATCRAQNDPRGSGYAVVLDPRGAR